LFGKAVLEFLVEGGFLASGILITQRCAGGCHHK